MNSKTQTWITVDLEYDFETDQTKGITEILPKLLELFDAHKIRATFFVLGKIAEEFPDVIKKIAKKHEIASHGYSHVRLDRLDDAELWTQVSKSKNAIEKLGIKCKGFRAPYFVSHPKLFSMLEKAGYEYDSSLQCSYFPGRYNNVFVKKNEFKIQGTNLTEYPIPNWTIFRFPAAGFSYYRLFWPFSKLFKIPQMIYLHPCEFLDMPNNKMSPFVKEVYRFQKKDKAWEILTEIVEKYKHCEKT